MKPLVDLSKMTADSRREHRAADNQLCHYKWNLIFHKQFTKELTLTNDGGKSISLEKTNIWVGPWPESNKFKWILSFWRNLMKNQITTSVLKWKVRVCLGWNLWDTEIWESVWALCDRWIKSVERRPSIPLEWRTWFSCNADAAVNVWKRNVRNLLLVIIYF